MLGLIISSIISAGMGAYNGRKQRKAAKKGVKQARDSEKQARLSEVFSQTEGEGLGGLGRLRLGVDEEDPREFLNNRRNRLRI